jgi:hypothetical protein
MPPAKPNRTPPRKTSAPATTRGHATARARKATPAAAEADDGVVRALRALLLVYAEGRVVRDEPGAFELATAKPFGGKPMFFGAARAREGYVSFQLMPVSVFPELLDGISAKLRSTLDDTSTFRLRTLSPALLHELAGLTVAGLDLFRKADLA